MKASQRAGIARAIQNYPSKLFAATVATENWPRLKAILEIDQVYWLAFRRDRGHGHWVILSASRPPGELCEKQPQALRPSGEFLNHPQMKQCKVRVLMSEGMAELANTL